MKSNEVIRALILFTVLLLCSVFAQAQQDSSFLKREVKIAAETYGYRVFIPKNHNAKQKSPVMLFLHGNGSNGTDNEQQIQELKEFIVSKPKIFNFIIVFPQARPGGFWDAKQTEQAVKAFDQTVAEFNGDAQRLYLAGHSMGGYGTWTTAVLYPNKFAALVPLAGGIVPPFKLSPIQKLFFPKQLVEILDMPNPYEALASKIGNTPVWVFHGANDESVPVKESRNIVAALKKNGSKNVTYTEYPNTNHNDVLKAFADSKLYEWLGRQKLNK